MYNRFGVLCRALLISIFAAASGFAQSDRVTLIGSVRDTGGAPIPLTRLSSSGILTLADSGGRFVLIGLPVGKLTLSARRLGYEPRDVLLDLVGGRVDSIAVVLTILPRDLPGVLTEADVLGDPRLADFYRHRRGGNGYFLDRREIEARHAQRISDILRRIPGVRIVTDRSGRSQLRMGRAMGGRDCPPDFWIDGVRTPFLGVDDIPIGDVEAFEIYRGPSGLPPEFNSRLGSPGCGTVVIWTRLPG